MAVVSWPSEVSILVDPQCSSEELKLREVRKQCQGTGAAAVLECYAVPSTFPVLPQHGLLQAPQNSWKENQQTLSPKQPQEGFATHNDLKWAGEAFLDPEKICSK